MFFFAPPSAASKLVDAALAAHAKLSTVRVHVALDALTGSTRQRSTYDMDIDPSKVLIRIQEPRHSGQDRSDRTYFFSGGKLLAYDVLANERLSRDLPPNASRVDQVAFIFGSVPDLIRGFLNPAEITSFLTQTRSVNSWSAARRHGLDLIMKNRPGSNKIDVLGFDPQSHLLRRVDVGSQGYTVHWTFDYSKPRPISFKIPASARKVTAFTIAPEPPKYLTKDAEQITKAMLEAEVRYTSGVITVSGSRGRSKIVLDGKRIREEGPDLSYAYDGTTLTVLGGRRRQFYRGQAIRGTIPDLLVQIGAGVDPLSRQILQHRIPFREILRPKMKISVAGQIETPDGACDTLSLDGGTTKVTIFVRRKDHLVAGIMSSIFDGLGRLLSTSNRQFHYAPYKAGSVRFALDSKPGQAVLSLPELKLNQ